ncbi:hypothetical protein KCP70_25300 [Salmonella enterica subsp. enterica]|nr:hypothetical protein KCP70_25300 [Salmonella enterica subsp. enterica]
MRASHCAPDRPASDVRSSLWSVRISTQYCRRDPVQRNTAATAWTGTRDGINPQSDGWRRHISATSFFRRRAPEKREIIILHKEHIRAGLPFQHAGQPTATGRAVKSGATVPSPEISPRDAFFATGVPPRRTRPSL